MNKTFLPFIMGQLRPVAISLLTALMLVGGSSFAWADETLTINESSTNTNYGVPFNAGKLTTSGTYGEFLVLSSQISSLAGNEITGMTFYTNKAADWGSASFTVCLKEVENTYYTSSTGPLGSSGTTTVYTGGLCSSNDKEVSIVFDTHFTYSGTNSLLVRINCTNTTGTDVEVNFTGANGADWSNASYTSYGTTSSLTRQRFQPKVTFTYEEPAVPTLSISPSGAASFGNVTADVNKTYTIVNNTGSAVTVTPSIDGDDAGMFSVSPYEATEIASGSNQTFTISFDWQADIAKLGYKEAIVSFTPDNGDAPFEIAASATATTALILDELTGSSPALSSGEKSSILIKYTPQNGWNTICMPFALYSKGGYDYMTPIFGEGWKAYTLSGFADKVLTFSKSPYSVSGGTPYLVYVESAASHPSGVLVENRSINYTSPSSSASYGTGTTATFRGTFAPIEAPGMAERWGVTTAGKLAQGTNKASIKGYRAYIETSDPAEARLSLAIDEDDATTLIGAVKMMENTNEVYNLNGQRVENVKRGLYVVNGRKVVIK